MQLAKNVMQQAKVITEEMQGRLRRVDIVNKRPEEQEVFDNSM